MTEFVDPELTALKLGDSPFCQQRFKHRRKIREVKPPHSMKAINCSLTFCGVFIALLGIVYLCFDPIVKHILLNQLVLRNQSEFAELWQNPPITPHLKVYFFNFTNAEDFFKGKADPVFKEVGPYTYTQNWTKENVEFHDDGTMSYQTRKRFTFVRELSVGDHREDNITLPNVPAISALYQMRNSYFIYGLTTLLYGMSYQMWATHTAEEFIWGYQETLFDVASMTLPNPPPLKKFGFFTKSNASDSLSTYTMFTGEGNPYNLSKISKFNGVDSLNVWDDEFCNKVQGSDGATFNPYIHKDDTLWFFNDQLCRSLPMVFEREVMSRELPGYRFVPREDVFQPDGEKFPQNKCFCAGEDLCDMVGAGMFPVTRCQMDAPIVLSWPHFLGANSTYTSRCKGLNPDRNRHGFWFDVQPTTGTTLSAKARIQINIAVRKQTSSGYLDRVNDTVVPMLWFEEGVDELGPELYDVIGGGVLSPPIYKNYVLCVLLGVATATVAIAGVALTRWCANRRRRGTRSDLHDLSPANFDVHVVPDAVIKASNFVQKKRGHALQPSHGSGKFLLPQMSSEESSRQSSKNHSRNSSTGSTPPTFVAEPMNREETDGLLTGNPTV